MGKVWVAFWLFLTMALSSCGDTKVIKELPPEPTGHITVGLGLALMPDPPPAIKSCGNILLQSAPGYGGIIVKFVGYSSEVQCASDSNEFSLLFKE